MKIILVDNFNRENISDVLVATNVSNRHAELIVNLLNEKFSCDNSSIFYKSVEDGHELYEFDP